MEKEREVLFRQLASVNPQRREEATEQLEQIWISEAGPEAELRLLSAETLCERQEYDAAEAALSALIQDFPDYAEAWLRRGTVRYHCKKYFGSLTDYMEAVLRDQDHFGAWHGLGECFVSLREYAAAACAFRRALQIQPFAEPDQNLLYECLTKIN